MADDILKVLIVDDMAIYRKILSDVVGAIPGTTVTGTAYEGRTALKKMAVEVPDLVLMDVDMPGMDGLAALKEISALYPVVGVVIVSGLSDRAADLTIQALELGALDFVLKPQTKDAETSRRELIRALKPLFSIYRTRKNFRDSAPATSPVRVGRLGPTTPSSSRPTPSTKPSTDATVSTVPPKDSKAGAQATRAIPPPQDFSLVAIGVSTGGPRALSQLIPSLDSRLRLPIVCVQHMPTGFTRSLAAQLQRKSPLVIKEAEEGEPLAPGKILIAPGGRHMLVRRRDGELVAGLNDSPPVKSCRPSVDVLFRSLVGLVAAPVLTVIMTGMGDDGADAVQALSRHGSYNLVQDRISSVVYGMPKAVIARGLADEILPLESLALRINELLRSGGPR